MSCCFGIAAMGLLWPALDSGTRHFWNDGHSLVRAYICMGPLDAMNGVLPNRLTLRRMVVGAATLLASLIAAALAGPDDYWLAGVWIGGADFSRLAWTPECSPPRRSEKVSVNRKPKTWFQITPDGRHALERLFQQLEELLNRAGRDSLPGSLPPLTSSSTRHPQPIPAQ
jgi:hypothetical protein